MSKPLITFSLSDDEQSVFVYEPMREGPGMDLVACIGLQREDVSELLTEHLRAALAGVTNRCEYTHAHTRAFCGMNGCRDS